MIDNLSYIDQVNKLKATRTKAKQTINIAKYNINYIFLGNSDDKGNELEVEYYDI